MTTLALAEIRLKQLFALTKPRVVSLIVFVAVIGMFLATPGLPPPDTVFFATVGIALVAGAAAAINCLVEQKIDALMARTRRRPLPRGELTSLPTLVFAGTVGGSGLLLLVPLRQRADHVADARDLRRLRHHLHGAAEAGDAAEHRHRRRVGRDAAGAGLGRGDRRRRPRGADPLSDHLRLDAAALLVARAVPRRKTTRAPGCRCCR